jgi:hypothetical protein
MGEHGANTLAQIQKSRSTKENLTEQTQEEDLLNPCANFLSRDSAGTQVVT